MISNPINYRTHLKCNESNGHRKVMNFEPPSVISVTRNKMSQQLNDIVVVGACNIDLQCFTPHLPKPGETLHGREFMKGFGGKGANQCVSAAKLGGNVALVSRVGMDTFGNEFIENLKACNVNTECVFTTADVPTGVAQITVADNGENAIVIVTGANDLLNDEDMKSASHLITSAKVLVCQCEVPLAISVAALKLKTGLAIMNAAPALEDMDPEIFKLCDIFCVNEPETETVVGEKVSSIKDAKFAVGKLLKRGCRTVIITLGAQGAVFASVEDPTPVHVPTTTVDCVIDTTGAGDMFIGSLAYYLAYHPNLPMKEKVWRSCVLATMSVQKPGTQKSYPAKHEVPQELLQDKILLE